MQYGNLLRSSCAFAVCFAGLLKILIKLSMILHDLLMIACYSVAGVLVLRLKRPSFCTDRHPSSLIDHASQRDMLHIYMPCAFS